MSRCDMLVENYDELAELWSKHPDAIFAQHGPVAESIIQSAEAYLGTRFPESYRTFLERYGAGTFCGQDFLGLSGKDFADQLPSNTIWISKSAHHDGGLPERYLCVMAFGYDGGHAVIDLRLGEGGKIYEWFPAYGVNEDEPIANSFLQLLCQETEEFLKIQQG